MKRASIAFVAIALFGCGKQKEADCRTLVQAVGPAHASVIEAFRRGDQEPAELETQANGWEQSAKSLRALAVKDDDVKALASDYADVLDKAAKLRRDMASSASALDPTAAAKAQAGAAEFIIDETKLKVRVDATCR